MFIASLYGGDGEGVWEWSGGGECGSGVGERNNFCTGDPRFEGTAVYLDNYYQKFINRKALHWLSLLVFFSSFLFFWPLSSQVVAWHLPLLK